MNEDFKTLGLLWNPKQDILFFTVNLKLKGQLITKRQILSCMAQIFDPLGFITPFATVVKIILQKLWQLKLSWDESIPLNLRTRWLDLYKNLSALDEIRIPRHALCINTINVQLHAFCDASEAAYGACIYIRACDELKNVSVRLLTSKSRVAPLKKISIPRLDLCGALVLSQLVKKVCEAMKISFDHFYYWSDSTIALCWIKACPSRWKTFVANRVSEIQNNVGISDWYHIDGTQNPADLVSRGLDPEDLRDSKLWWNGPCWLELPVSDWPVHNIDEAIGHACVEEEKVVTLAVIDKGGSDILSRYSKFVKMQRIIAYCLRFLHNLKGKDQNKRIGNLTMRDIFDATILICKIIQRRDFHEEIVALERKKNISNKSKLLSLSPFLDGGLLRVGGRLKNSDFSYTKKHPILLPKDRITKLIIEQEHERLCHAGPQAVLASLRERFWPISGRSQVRNVIMNCIKCYRTHPKSAVAYMGDLPANRLLSTRPFLRTGVDYAGPFAIRDRKGRGAKLVKSYVSLFICFSTKAVHIELVGDLTTENFLAALRRFVSRRGKPIDIYSDNGTTFVGARRELSELSSFLTREEANIEDSVCKLNIQWHFIPPRSPHFGGLWEAGVKSVKGHLKKVFADASLIYEEFYSVLVQIEACVNSRPLSPMSDDPNDFLPLTPAHFLVGESLTSIPDPDLSHLSENRLSRFQNMQRLVQHFWKRWSIEYVSELQTRSKWKNQEESLINVGTMVILKEDNLSPVHWKMGRVIATQEGTDGVLRVATVKTVLGEFKRAITKLCSLPFEGNQ